MKIVLLGYRGMLGHQLAKVLNRQHDIHGYGSESQSSAFDMIERWKPDVIINAAGIVKQRTDVSTEEMIETNSLLPHRLFAAACNVGARLIHFSTDCVFSGDNGAYTEDSRPDPIDLYGRSKLLGEVEQEGCLTIRTSIIGREIGTRKLGLVEWFLSQYGAVEGYAHSYFSGLTTNELARLVARVLREQTDLSGIWHVTGPSISKLDLLNRMAIAFGHDTQIIPDYTRTCNRVLRADRFNGKVGYEPPSWNTMLKELANE
jgi:dTDP-4-dehydrorhamnose reductase